MSLAATYRALSSGERVRFTALILFILICALAGGASRTDVLGPTVVRLAAIGLLVLSVGHLRRSDMAAMRWPFLILLGFVALGVLQLLPLPPSLWTSLPGRQLYVEVIVLAGIEPGWRAMSLTPDLTLNSILAALPPLALLAAVASLPSRARYALVPVIIGIILFSAMIGLIQLTDGTGRFYLYQVTNIGFPVGLFANRNHQALLLVIAIPLLVIWVFQADRQVQALRYRALSAALPLLFLIPLILVTGSRAALILSLLVLVPAVLQIEKADRSRFSRTTASGRFLILIGLALAAAILATFMLARAEAFGRIFSADVTLDHRFTFLPQMAAMVRDSFPFGFGLGAFESVFRSYEPVDGLKTTYFNHAHNDLMEILIETGLFGALLVLGGLIWFIRLSFAGWRSGGNQRLAFARLGSIMLAMIMAASLVDYPLRTPFFAVLAALSAAWLAGAGRASSGIGLAASAEQTGEVRL